MGRTLWTEEFLMVYVTKRQRQILDFIASFQSREGFAPSLEEIAAHLGLSAVSTIHEHLVNLERKGLLRREGHRARKVRKASKGHRASRGPKASKGHRVSRAHRVSKDPKASRGPKATRDLRAMPRSTAPWRRRPTSSPHWTAWGTSAGTCR